MKKILFMMKFGWLLLLALLQTGTALAQVTILFNPSLNGLSVNGLFTAQLRNSSPLVYHGRIRIAVRDALDKTVLLVQTPDLLIRPGMNALQPLASQSRLQFGNSASGAILAQTGRFPENDYVYCYEFTGAENKPATTEQVFENCFNYSVQPLLSLRLLHPFDGDELCTTRPVFNWQPVIPQSSSYRYRISVVEIKDQQEPASALANNVPVFEQENIPGAVLPYPAQAPSLQEEKKYAWQVTASQGTLNLSRSEIWSFNMHCSDKKADSAKDSYRQLSVINNGNYYLASGMLRFSIINPYERTKLAYSITDITDPGTEISNLPPVKVPTGLSKVDISLEDVGGLHAGRFYLLRVTNIGDHVLYLPFIYKQNSL